MTCALGGFEAVGIADSDIRIQNCEINSELHVVQTYFAQFLLRHVMVRSLLIVIGTV